jgi:hypothetical protein
MREFRDVKRDKVEIRAVFPLAAKRNAEFWPQWVRIFLKEHSYFPSTSFL